MTLVTYPHGKNKLSAALAYARRGKSIFPLRPGRKTPMTSNGFHDASKDPSIISAWWSQWPEANIGIPTGTINGFWVLDIDGEEGENSLRRLEGAHGMLPATIEVITGRGGRHLYFSLPTQGQIRNSAGQLGFGLDVRGDGGYIVAPPSIHENGRVYAYSVDSCNHTMAAPAWLLSLIQTPVKEVSPADWRTLAKGVAEGGRNDAIARIAGKLLRSRLDPYLALELCLAWNESRCRPPLPPDEVTQTVDSIAGREMARRGGRA